jgi:hypothetical protein
VGTSLQTLRRSVGDTLGDLMVLRATSAGTATTFTDVVRMGDRGTNAPTLMNRIGYFPLSQTEVRTTAFETGPRTIHFAPGVAPSETEVGREMELWSIADRLGSLGALHRLLNDGIRSVQDLAGVEVYTDPADWRVTDPQIAIPPGWSELGGAEWADRRNNSGEIRKTDVLVRYGKRTLEIQGRGARLATGGTVALWGYLRATPLVAEDDETDVDAEWLVDAVTTVIALAQSWRGTDRASEERRANFWSGRADVLRRKLGPPRRGWGISLP